VYRRTGQPCLRCGRDIRRIVVGQRSTHFCPYCQRPPEEEGG
jgi:formamidopyrimidine-DNA glycosylase